jgi:hypothetical protein
MHRRVGGVIACEITMSPGTGTHENGARSGVLPAQLRTELPTSLKSTQEHSAAGPDLYTPTRQVRRPATAKGKFLPDLVESLEQTAEQLIMGRKGHDAVEICSRDWSLHAGLT